MESEAFDIGRLLPEGITRIALEIRLKGAKVTIRVFSAEEQLKRTAPLGGAILWREGRGAVLISVPEEVHVTVIDADVEI